jgi:hypothetical protein
LPASNNAGTIHRIAFSSCMFIEIDPFRFVHPMGVAIVNDYTLDRGIVLERS